MYQRIILFALVLYNYEAYRNILHTDYRALAIHISTLHISLVFSVCRGTPSTAHLLRHMCPCKYQPVTTEEIKEETGEIFLDMLCH